MVRSKTVERVKSLIKRTSPAFYDFAIKKMSSQTVRTLLALHKIPGENKLIARNAPRFAVNIDGRMGMGAVMSWAVGILGYCDENQLLPRLIFTNPLYATAPGEDWLEGYFERGARIREFPGELALPPDCYLPQLGNLQRRIQPIWAKLTIERAHDLFFSSLKFKKDLIDETDAFCNVHGVSAETIGVHFRGTDKRLEATTTRWTDLAASVDACLGGKLSNIFVATDEPEFLEFMRSRFSRGRVIDLGCREIYSGFSAHFAPGNPAVKASEAIRTIITLSRCGMLIRTRSHLSAWAKIVKPALPTIVFGEMLPGDQMLFPEHLLKTEGS
jgi:hypothetical protein